MYRKCVGIILLNPLNNKVLVGRRADYRADAWQLPQGGVEADESFIEAAFREMEEEIGTNNAEIIAESPDLMRYELPLDLQNKLWGGKYVGQEQKWYLMRFLGDESEINIHTENPEFLEYKWVELEETLKLIVEFKRDVYNNLVQIFAPIIKSQV